MAEEGNGSKGKRVPPLLFLPAGSMSSKQSSLEIDELPADYFRGRSSTDPLSESLRSDIVVHSQFMPLESTLSGCSPLLQWAEECTSGETFSVEVATQTDVSPNCEEVRLLAEIASLKASIARYEQQNQDLRCEIHYSTNDLLTLDRAKREATTEVYTLKSALAAHEADIAAVSDLFERISSLLPAEDARDLACESIPSRCKSLFSDFEMMCAKLSRLTVMHDHISGENQRLSAVFTRLELSEKRCKELQAALIQKEKVASVLEDQVAVLRSAASKGTASTSGRNSSEAGKRTDLIRNGSMSKSPAQKSGEVAWEQIDSVSNSSSRGEIAEGKKGDMKADRDKRDSRAAPKPLERRPADFASQSTQRKSIGRGANFKCKF